MKAVLVCFSRNPKICLIKLSAIRSFWNAQTQYWSVLTLPTLGRSAPSLNCRNMCRACGAAPLGPSGCAGRREAVPYGTDQGGTLRYILPLLWVFLTLTCWGWACCPNLIPDCVCVGLCKSYPRLLQANDFEWLPTPGRQGSGGLPVFWKLAYHGQGGGSRWVNNCWLEQSQVPLYALRGWGETKPST